MAGDVLFRLKLGIEPLRYRLAAIPFLLATIPLGSGVSGMAQLLAMIAVFVAVLFLEKRARGRDASPLPDDDESVQPRLGAPHLARPTEQLTHRRVGVRQRERFERLGLRVESDDGIAP